MKKITIAFFDTKQYDIDSFDKTNANFGYEIKYYKEHLTIDTMPLTKGADIVCLFVNDQVTAEMIRSMKTNGVKLIALRCAGYNNIDLQAAYEHIPVVRVPAYSPYAVAEHAVALMLTLNRKTHKAYIRTRDNNFTINGFTGFDLFGKTAGIIGTGKIGLILIDILKGFGMNVLAFDAFPNASEAQKKGFTYTDLDTLYKESSIISLHCPLTKETEYIINEKSIAQMKKDVMIINTSRGKLIDTKALIDGLKTGQIGYAGLDVYEEESEYFFEDFSTEIISDDVLARLMTFPNVLITSHQAFFTREALANIAGTTLDNIKSFVEKKELPNEICYRCGQTTGKCKKVETGRCFDVKE